MNILNEYQLVYEIKLIKYLICKFEKQSNLDKFGRAATCKTLFYHDIASLRSSSI